MIQVSRDLRLLSSANAFSAKPEFLQQLHYAVPVIALYQNDVVFKGTANLQSVFKNAGQFFKVLRGTSISLEQGYGFTLALLIFT